MGWACALLGAETSLHEEMPQEDATMPAEAPAAPRRLPAPSDERTPQKASKGLRMVLATNGTFVTDEVARKLIAAGIRRVSVSIDGPDPASHDAFRGVPGAFAEAMAGIEGIRAGLIKALKDALATEPRPRA